MEYKVSVIVPIYNVEQYIRRALDSLVNQTLEELEIILVDDGTTDDSGRIADEYAGKYPNIVVIHKKNGGLSDARNAGLKVTHAEYIGFIDPDDDIEPNMFALLYHSIVNEYSDLAICGYVEVYSENLTENRSIDLSEYGNSKRGLTNAFIKGEFGAYAWNKLYKKSIIDENSLRFPKGIQLVEDTVFFSDYLKYVDSYTVVKECLYHYIRNSNSICAKYHKRQFEYYREAYYAKKELIETNQYDTEALNKVNDIGYLKTCMNVLNQIHSVGNKAKLKERCNATLLVVQDEKFKELFYQYQDQLEDKEQQKKSKYILKNQMSRLIIYEIWKMRIVARIKYYLG